MLISCFWWSINSGLKHNISVLSEWAQSSVTEALAEENICMYTLFLLQWNVFGNPWQVFTDCVLPFEITYLNSEAQRGGLFVMELHIEPQQPNLANGEKSAAQERKAFDFKTHTKKKMHLRDAHTRLHSHTKTSTLTHTCTWTMPQGTRVTPILSQSPCGTRTRHGMPSGVGRRVC